VKQNRFSRKSKEQLVCVLTISTCASGVLVAGCQLHYPGYFTLISCGFYVPPDNYVAVESAQRLGVQVPRQKLVWW